MLACLNTHSIFQRSSSQVSAIGGQTLAVKGTCGGWLLKVMSLVQY